MQRCECTESLRDLRNELCLELQQSQAEGNYCLRIANLDLDSRPEGLKWLERAYVNIFEFKILDLTSVASGSKRANVCFLFVYIKPIRVSWDSALAQKSSWKLDFETGLQFAIFVRKRGTSSCMSWRFQCGCVRRALVPADPKPITARKYSFEPSFGKVNWKN